MQVLKATVGAVWLLAACMCLGEEGRIVDVEIPAGTNYAVARFRFWHPPDATVLRAVAVLVPGSNDDGRTLAKEPFWQDFARRYRLALLGCCFKDHPHENMNIEEYARAADGSGPALLEALGRSAKATRHAEVASAPSCFGDILRATSSTTSLEGGGRQGTGIRAMAKRCVRLSC